MPAPQWFFRFMYDRESAAWERRRDQPEGRALVERTVDDLAAVVAPPGPVADLGCGPGAHSLELARRGYEVTGLDGSPRMVEVARTRAERDGVDADLRRARRGRSRSRSPTGRSEASSPSTSSSTSPTPPPSSPRSAAASVPAGTC